MPFFLIMSPFITFTAASFVISLTLSLAAAAVVAGALVLADHLRGADLKALTAGPLLMFAALALWFAIDGEEWRIRHIYLALDGGILAIALGSILLGRPFTLAYAREHVDAATARQPDFLRINYVLSWVWAGTMTLMVAANVLIIYTAWFPLWAGVVAIFALRQAAVQFSKWYPRHLHPEHVGAL